jgi:hypothetical protein
MRLIDLVEHPNQSDVAPEKSRSFGRVGHTREQPRDLAKQIHVHVAQHFDFLGAHDETDGVIVSRGVRIRACAGVRQPQAFEAVRYCIQFRELFCFSEEEPVADRCEGLSYLLKDAHGLSFRRHGAGSAGNEKRGGGAALHCDGRRDGCSLKNGVVANLKMALTHGMELEKTARWRCSGDGRSSDTDRKVQAAGGNAAPRVTACEARWRRSRVVIRPPAARATL